MSESSNARGPADLAMPQIRETARSWLLVPTLYCLISLALLPLGYNLFHFSVETGCVVIGMMALLVANISRRFTSSSLLIIAGCGLGWVALLDFLHVMSFPDMGLLPGDTTNLTSQLWIIGRLLQALALLGAVLLMHVTVRLLFVHLACGLFTLVCLGLLYMGLFPTTFVPGEGLTGFKINMEYLIIAMLVVAAVQVQRLRGSFTTRKYLGIQLALGAMMLSELCFTQYQTTSDEFNIAGHLLKVFSYWFLFRVLVEQTLLQPFTDRSHLLVVLGERLKEMKCLNELARIAQQHEGDTRAFLAALVGILPAAMLHDKVVRVSIDSALGRFGIDPELLPDDRCIVTPLVVEGQQTGSVRVGYPAQTSLPQPLFLDEEYQLMELVGVRVSAMLDRQHDRETIQQLNRLYRMLSGVNRAVVRSSSQSQLMSDVFAILRENQGFTCIGIAERAAAQDAFGLTYAHRLPPAMFDQLAAELQVLAAELWPGSLLRRPGTALLKVDTLDQPVLAAALREAGSLELALVPIAVHEQVLGLLVVAAPAGQEFHAGEEGLLDEMVDDVSFAMSHLRQGQRLLEVEGRVEDTERRYEVLFNQSPVPMILMDAGALKVLARNRAYEQWLGFPLCEITDIPEWFSRVIDEPERAEVLKQQFYENVGKSFAPFGYFQFPETHLHDSNGRALVTTARLTNVQDHILVVFNDITQLKERESRLRDNEQQLRQSAALLEDLAQQVPGVIYQFRVFADGRSCFPFATQSLWDIYEVRPEQVKEDATAVFQRIHPDDIEQVKASIAVSARDMTLWQEDYRVVLPQQGLRWRSGNARPQRLEDGSTLWHGFIEDSTARKQMEEEQHHINQMLQRSVTGTLEIISRIMDQRDPYTAGHQHRVGQIARLIGMDMGLDKQMQEMLELTGVVHDVGKIAVPTEILTKPTRLSEIELQIVRGHASAGYEMLKGTNLPRVIIDAIHQHHERLDGSGYPQGLKGNEITLEARIIAVADVLESMSSHRPYRPALGIGRAVQELERGRGSSYDAMVVDVVLKIVREQRLPVESPLQ